MLLINMLWLQACIVSHPSREAVTPEDYDLCHESGECVIAELNCGATNGFRVAVSRDAQDEITFPYAETYNIEASGDPTCQSDVAAACIAGRCELLLMPKGSCEQPDETCAPGLP